MDDFRRRAGTIRHTSVLGESCSAKSLKSQIPLFLSAFPVSVRAVPCALLTSMPNIDYWKLPHRAAIYCDAVRGEGGCRPACRRVGEPASERAGGRAGGPAQK